LDNSIIQQYLELYDLNEDLIELAKINNMDIKSGSNFTDFEKFCTSINQSSGKHITIYPDYDVDGICSGLIAYYGLKSFEQFESVNLYAPVTKFGYGINPMSLHHLMNQFPETQVIITTDNGVNAKQAIEIAKNIYNVDVIVTDHHVGRIDLYPNNALAVIDPNRKDKYEKYEFKEISGAVVIWKLLLAYFEKFEMTFPKSLKTDLESLEYLAGISVISDMMPIIEENREYVKNTLVQLDIEILKDIELLTEDKHIRQLHHIMIKFLNKLKDDKLIYNDEIDESDIGFVISPLLNSVRRVLDDSSIAFKLFINQNSDEYIDKMINHIIELNKMRKEIVKYETEIANEFVIEKEHVIVYQRHSITHGIAGLIASNLVKKYKKPAIVLCHEFSGSARSLNNLSLQDAFKFIDMHNENIINNWGGHNMAAGINVNSVYLNEFTELLNEFFANFENITPKQKVIQLNLNDEKIINELLEAHGYFDELKPFSEQYPKPIYQVKFDIRNLEFETMKYKHLKIQLNDDLKLIYWNGFEEFLETHNAKPFIKANCRFEINEFKNKKYPQLIVETLEYSETPFNEGGENN